MSTPDQPESTPLTRRRLREIRATGATPVIPPGTAGEPPAPAPEPAPSKKSDNATSAPKKNATKKAEAKKPAEDESESRASDAPRPVSAVAPLPRPAEPAPVPPAPIVDAAVDLGVAPLTRRQARAHERIRTASVPVIHSDLAPGAAATAVPPAVVPAAEAPESAAEPVPAKDAAAPAEEAHVDAESEEVHEPESAEEADIAVVHPELGSDLLEGQVPSVSIPPSFDQLIARSSPTGAVATPNALILSETPHATPMSPITATGEVLITGSFDLPEGLGSVGHAHGTADGKEVDATLIDGELPPSSSPTPIAASAAISTARHSGEEIIRPPAPEKGNRLMLALVITAGVLALALVGVLILAVTTGVFS